MRREAVVQCLLTARGQHKHAWARTGIELLIEHCHEHRARWVEIKLWWKGLTEWGRSLVSKRGAGTLIPFLILPLLGSAPLSNPSWRSSWPGSGSSAR